MHDRRSKTPNEDLGIRAFKTRQARAVETAIGRMRHGLSERWSQLSTEEIEELRWVLGELWAYVSHATRDELHFGLLSLEETDRVIALGEQVRRHERPPVEVLEEIAALVSSKG